MTQQDLPPTITSTTDPVSPIEPHPDLPVLGPLAGSWSRTADDTWWWSDEMYAIHGFRPGEIKPTTEIVLWHKHPEDRERSQRILASALQLDTPFSNYHRIVDTHRQVRHVLTVGRGYRDEHGHLVEVSGYMVDLSAVRRRETQPAVEQALAGAFERRSVIEQAKGALMVTHGLDEDTAFDLLRTASANNNRKLRDIAADLIERIHAGTTADDPVIASLLTSDNR